LPIDELLGRELAQASSSPLSPRVTLRSPIRLTPFDHYWHKPPSLERNHYEYSCRKLGITEEKLRESFNEDIDSLLREIEEVRTSSEATPTPSTFEHAPAAAPVERVLSKDECFLMLQGRELNTGSLLGMYLWAADLGRARYWNFEMNWDQESIEKLNAYDLD
jgi:hypothetical protein